MSELVRIVKLVAVHQSVSEFEYPHWQQAGDAIRFEPNILENRIPVNFYDGLIEPLCALPYPVPADGTNVVVSSFRKERGTLIFENPSTNIEESIKRLTQKEQQRIEEFRKGG